MQELKSHLVHGDDSTDPVLIPSASITVFCWWPLVRSISFVLELQGACLCPDLSRRGKAADLLNPFMSEILLSLVLLLPELEEYLRTRK